MSRRVVLVTGGGRGLGRSHALALGALGHAVLVNDTGGALDGRGYPEPGVAEGVAADVRAAGGAAVSDTSDGATHDGARALVERAVGEFGRLDAIVHSAGILRDKTFARLAPEDFDEVVRVHLGGPAHLTHAAWPALVESGAGRVVLTSSASGLFGQFGQANYGAAKAGLVGLMNVLRQEGARSGIGVNVIAPVARTRMTAPLLAADVLRGLDPAHVSGLVAHLASAECTHSGLVLEVGAGLVARVQVMSSETRELPPTGDDAGMSRLLDELTATDDHEGHPDSPASLARLLDHARTRS